tara:strand:+ start:5209 stop:5433 length:225 start_codon:yes stop_codon:yes gene_type:complete
MSDLAKAAEARRHSAGNKWRLMEIAPLMAVSIETWEGWGYDTGYVVSETLAILEGQVCSNCGAASHDKAIGKGK